MIKLDGLTAQTAEQRLKKFGPNTLPEEKHNPLLLFLTKFWTPISWLLEIIIALEFFLGRFVEAGVIIALLLFNALLSFFQENKAKNALVLLRNKLKIQVRVLRDGKWKFLSAQELVPDDIIRIRMGDIVPADIKLIEGSVLIDQSVITGESLPVAPAIGERTYAGAVVKHGEAYAQVLSTGKNTFYGKTAEIMRQAKTPSHLEGLIFSIVKALVTIDIFLIIFVFVYSLYQGISLSDIAPFSLLLLVASVPVALPATYALSTALGSIDLAKEGILVTRLSAIEEAAALDILCVDKTGTITQNELQVSALRSYIPYTDDDLLTLAALASEESTQDPLDLVILAAAKDLSSKYASAEKIQFIPFDPDRKCSEAIVHYDGQKANVLKGAPIELLKKIDVSSTVYQDVESLSSNGSRLLAILLQEKSKVQLVGLIALQDPPRETSKRAIREIHELGVKVMMITGDTMTTALSIATQVGIGSRLASREDMQSEKGVRADVIAGVFPEDKYQIIQQLQNKGHICGMTGDGVNDAPALKKAEVGIAVSNATDVAKAAASLILTNPGMTDLVKAVKSSRQIYQRMLTYTLNKIIKTLQISVLLGIGLIITNQFIISQLLIVLFLFANDFMTMSIATDRVSFSQKPDKWDIKKLMLIGGIFAVLILGFSFGALFFGVNVLHLTVEELRTFVFLLLVFTGQATVYLIRERKHFWHSMPSKWMIASTLFDLVAVGLLAIYGVWMAAISFSLVLGLLATVILFYVILDFLKVKIACTA